MSLELAHPGSPRSSGRRRDGHTAVSRAMVHSITYHACSPFSLYRRLLIATHLACHHRLIYMALALALALASVRFGSRAFNLSARVVPAGAFARGWRVPGCLLGYAGVRLSATATRAPQAERSALPPVAVKRVRASVSRLPCA